MSLGQAFPFQAREKDEAQTISTKKLHNITWILHRKNFHSNLSPTEIQ